MVSPMWRRPWVPVSHIYTHLVLHKVGVFMEIASLFFGIWAWSVYNNLPSSDSTLSEIYRVCLVWFMFISYLLVFFFVSILSTVLPFFSKNKKKKLTILFYSRNQTFCSRTATANLFCVSSTTLHAWFLFNWRLIDCNVD